MHPKTRAHRPLPALPKLAPLPALPLPLAAFGVLALAFTAGCDQKPSPGGAPAPVPSPAPSAFSASPATSASPRGSSAASVSSAASPTDKDPLAALSLGTIFRDDEDLVLDGVKENWHLEWARPPVPDCMGPASSTCACAGFAYGERGDLDLVRTAAGKPDERLRLDPFFEGNDTRMQRWAVTRGDTEAAQRGDGGAPLDMVAISMRPITSIIKLGDYDHDGRASEFLLQIAAGPCGHTPTIVVGVSKSNPKLHAFGTKEKPDEPLALDRASDWEKLRGKPSADIVQIACGDHGATEETTVHVRADGDLHATSDTKKCP